jgi:rhodanese-related sulfurtransferase
MKHADWQVFMGRGVAMKISITTKVLTAVALLALALCPALAAAKVAKPYWWGRVEALAQRDGYKLIRPAELKALYDQGTAMVVIDARTSHEFKAGHLPGARNVEFHMGHASRIDQAKEKELREAIGQDVKRRVVVYDRGLQCVRSQMAAQWAVNLGYENVWMLPEGWMGWAALTQTGATDGPRSAKKGDPFPKARLTLLDGERDRAYLGIKSGAASFELGSLSADYALVELYNQLCFACCQSIPELNRLLGLIQKEPELNIRLKMIGIGVGNLNRDVRRFRQEKGVSFPLFSDHDNELHRQLGRPALPVIYLVRLHGAAGLRIVAVLSGPFGPAEKMLKNLMPKLNLTAGLSPPGDVY